MATLRRIASNGSYHLMESDTVELATKRVAERSLGSMPVCDSDGRLRGLVTDQDLDDVARGKDPSSTKVGELSLREAVTADATDTIEVAVTKMQALKLRWIPVVDGDRFLGVVTPEDLSAWTARNSEPVPVTAETVSPGSQPVKGGGSDGKPW